MPNPAPFSSPDYWESRFTLDPSNFEWLQPASALDPCLREALDTVRLSAMKAHKILHIGCGTSFLSFHLRVHVDDPAQIHNVDFSAQAIELGKVKEVEIFESDEHASSDESVTPSQGVIEQAQPVPVHLQKNEAQEKRGEEGNRMRWSTVDLLSYLSLKSACGSEKYAIVVEKSTTDAIACGEDVEISLPFRLTPSPAGSKSDAKEHAFIHPVDVLALHLASITQPDGRWIALSYSAARFPFFPEGEGKGKAEKSYPDGFPDPATFWRLERKEPMVEAKSDKADEFVHRPTVAHWLYFLVRTEQDLL